MSDTELAATREEAMTAGRRGYFPAHDCRIGKGVEADRPGACLCCLGGGTQDRQGAPGKADTSRQADREKAHGPRRGYPRHRGGHAQAV